MACIRWLRGTDEGVISESKEAIYKTLSIMGQKCHRMVLSKNPKNVGQFFYYNPPSHHLSRVGPTKFQRYIYIYIWLFPLPFLRPCFAPIFYFFFFFLGDLGRGFDFIRTDDLM